MAKFLIVSPTSSKKTSAQLKLLILQSEINEIGESPRPFCDGYGSERFSS